MNERMGRTGRWLRSGNRIVVVDDEVSGHGAELDELRLTGLVSPPPLLRRGNRGPGVASLQRMLNTWVAKSGRLLAPLKEDGVFGPLTEGRVISFQRASGLLVDGIAGGKTLGALRAAIRRVSTRPKLVTDSPCLPGPAIVPFKLPMCFCVSGYKTNQPDVRQRQQPGVDFIVVQIARARDLSERLLVTVTGHTDDVGTPKDNIELGMARAKGVIKAIRQGLEDLEAKLIDPGAKPIDPPEIVPASAGEDRPIAFNDTPEGRADNRRVEVCISSGVFL
jgi:hypothetical protein